MPSQKNSQYNLFEENPDQQQSSNDDHPIEVSSMLKELQITEEDNKKESKLKQLISSRVKNIEKLKSLLEKDRKSLNRIKTLYNEKMQSEIDELCKEIARFTEQLIKRYGQKSFSMSQRETLEYLIENNFHDLMIKGYSNEKMSPLVLKYEELKKELYDFDDDLEDEMDDEYEDEFENEFNEDVDGDDDDLDEEFESAFTESMIKHILEQMGLEFDEEFFAGLDFNAPDFQTKFQERLFEYKQRQKAAEEKETKKQKTLSTDKEFTKLYKSLVKKVHPDLTTDETKRLRREELMKKLSSVWQNRDYYELLLLQSQIVDDSDVNITLNKNQLKQIADDLLEKKRELEQERFNYKRDPDNEFYFNFFARSDKKIKKNLDNYKQKLKEEKEDVEKKHLRSQNTKNH